MHCPRVNLHPPLNLETRLLEESGCANDCPVPSGTVRIPSRALQLQHGYDIQHTDWYLTISGQCLGSVRTVSMQTALDRWSVDRPDSSRRFRIGLDGIRTALDSIHADGIWISGYGIWMVSRRLWTVGLSGRLWTVSGQYPDGIWMISGYGIWMVSGRLWTVGLSGWLWTVSGQYPDGIRTVSRRYLDDIRIWYLDGIRTALDSRPIRMALDGIRTVSGQYPDGIRTVSRRYLDGIRMVSGRLRMVSRMLRTVTTHGLTITSNTDSQPEGLPRVPVLDSIYYCVCECDKSTVNINR